MNLYNLFEAPKRTPAPGTTGVMDNQTQSAASPIGSGTSRWEQKKKPVTMMGIGNNGVVVDESRDVQLDELSNKILGDYKKAAGADAAAADARGDYAHGDKRFRGIVKATKKELANDIKQHKTKTVAEGGFATVGWPDEGKHTGNNPPVSVGGTVPARPVVKKGSLVKASGLSGVHRVVDIRGDEAKIVEEIPNTGQSTYVPMADLRVWTNKPIREQGMAEAVGMIIKGAAISGPDDQDIADQIAARTGGRVDSGSRGHHILITYPTPQDRARAAVKIRKMFPGIELYKSGGNRNAIDEQGVAEGPELKQAKRKYNQAAKDANADQVGAGKKIDTMKKSLRQKDLGKEQGVAEGKKKSDTYHIVNKDGKPASLASYADKESAVKDRDAKHQGAEVRQLGPRGKVKSVAEGMKAHELSQYCEELVAEKGWDAAYKHAKFMAQGGTDPSWNSVLKYLKAMKDGVSEGWSQKYKNSINCSHPKGFSQRAHCAGKKKHNESVEMEMVCEDCGMCETHGDNLLEIKQRLDAKCWTGKHKEGTKIKGGIRVNNCVPNESVNESLGRATPKMPKPRDPGHAVLAAKRSSGAAGQHTNKKRQAVLQPKHQKPLTRDMDLGEGWKSTLGGAALAGAMALGAGGAQAQTSGEDFLPDIVAHVSFKVNEKEVSKDINLGTAYKSPREAADALEKFLKSKGIKYFSYTLERVSDKQSADSFMDKTPGTDQGMSAGMDAQPYRATKPAKDDYMVREELEESIERRLMQMRRAGYDI